MVQPIKASGAKPELGVGTHVVVERGLTNVF